MFAFRTGSNYDATCRLSYIWEFGFRLGVGALLGFPGESGGKESACDAGDLGSIPGSERYPGEGNDYPLQYSCLENPHGQRSLPGYSP